MGRRSYNVLLWNAQEGDFVKESASEQEEMSTTS